MTRVTVTNPTVGGSSGTWGGTLNANDTALAAAVNALGTAADAAAGDFTASLTPAAVKTTTYTAAVNDIVPCDATSAGFAVTLPTAPADKSRIIVKKIDTSANAITIARGGSDVFNKTGGSTSLTLLYQFQSVTLQYATTGAIWYVVASDPGVGGYGIVSGAVALTNAAGSLNADTTAATSAVTTLLTTAALGVGTWDVTFGATYLGTATAVAVDIAVMPGTATATFAGQQSNTSRYVASQASSGLVKVRVTITVAGTLLMQYFCAQAITFKAASTTAGAFPNATGYTAVRIA